jgi:hypothetical protein
MPEYNLSVQFSSARKLGVTMLSVGAVVLVISVIYVSSILAFIGLGLIFWGVIIFYVQSEEYTKNSVLNATSLSLQAAMYQALQELDYRGQAVYLPASHLNSPESNKVYIPKLRTSRLPLPEQTRKLDNQPSGRNNQGLLITPPGADLMKLFEEISGTSFTRVDLGYLQQNLPRLLIENLEVAQSVEIAMETTQAMKPIDEIASAAKPEQKVHVRIATSTFRDVAKQSAELSTLNGSIGCPLTSAIALVIAKATGEFVFVDREEVIEDGRIIDITYKVIQEEQP